LETKLLLGNMTCRAKYKRTKYLTRYWSPY